jgi:cation/acetate symporter
LLLVIGSSIGHDLYTRVLNRGATERERLMVGRAAIGLGVIGAGYFGINPPGFVSEVVAFAFGLASASFFPVIVLGVFSKRTTKEGAIAGMVTGLTFTAFYILWTTEQFFGNDPFLFEISPQGIGTVGMVLNFAVTWVVSRMTPEPPAHIQELVENVRIPEAISKLQEEAKTA